MTHVTRIGLILTAVCVVSSVPAWGTDDERAAALRRFTSEYCVHCHSNDDPAGGLSFTDDVLKSMPDDSRLWESVVRKLRSRQMPPPDEPRPAESAYRDVLQLLESSLDNTWEDDPNVGRGETFRRLTRFEYGNAIRDLLHLEINPTSLLPRDELSHGFDNIAVGELSPALLNRYVSAAQIISQLAVGAFVSSADGQTVRVRPDLTQEDHIPGLPIGTRGGVLIPYNFPRAGDYRVTVRLMRDRNEHVEGLRRDHDLEILVDRKRVARFTVRAPKSESDHATADRHLTEVISVSAGPHDLGITFPKKPLSLIETKRQPYEARFNFHRSPRQSPAVYEVTISGVSHHDQPEQTPSRNRILICSPVAPQGAESCARVILSKLLRRAYRRPVTEEDFTQPMEFFRRGSRDGGFEQGIQEAVASVLVNPNFLFRVERDPPDAEPGNACDISDVELASRLSFFLWSSIPDDELLDLTEAGQLRDPKVLADQVARMLKDARSHSLVTSFAGQWLYLRNLESITPDGRLFPDFDHNLRQAFRKETEMFFESIIREDRSVMDLLRADYTFLNERLAKHYEIPHIYGSRFRRVSLDPKYRRGGLLRQGSILTVTSYATRTSPVIRGHWILKNLTGSPPPPPPDDVPALNDNTVDQTLSVRERLAAHRANPACAGCHNLMDPVGFALENYDAVGRWRMLDAGKPVDASGGLPDGSRFTGVAGLEDGLLERPDLFAGTLADKLLTYALGRGTEYYDAPAIRKIVRRAAEHDYRFSEIIQGIVSSRPFQMRMAE